MKSTFTLLRIITIALLVFSTAKSIYLIGLYNDASLLVNEGILVNPLEESYEEFFVNIQQDNYGDSIKMFLYNNALKIEGTIFIFQSILFLFLYTVFTKSAKKESFPQDLIPFEKKWFEKVNLGVRRLIGLITNLTLISIIFVAVITNIKFVLNFLEGPPRYVFYDYKNLMQDSGSIISILIFSYVGVWTVFFILSWILFGFFSSKSLKA